MQLDSQDYSSDFVSKETDFANDNSQEENSVNENISNGIKEMRILKQ